LTGSPTALVTGATALGTNAQATGANSIAIGGNTVGGAGFAAFASGVGAIAIGNRAIASGDSSTVLGDGAQATQTGATAIGQGTVAAFANSTAIGTGAVTTAPNQMMFGTGASTYVAPGITSAASLAAQSGPTSFVTSDAAGHLAVSNINVGALENLSNNLTTLNQSVAGLQRDVSRLRSGVALAMAAGGVPTVPEGRTFGVFGNIAAYDGHGAFGAGLTGVVYRSQAYEIQAHGSIGVGFDNNDVGGRVGAVMFW
jgi:hypothetical protein